MCTPTLEEKNVWTLTHRINSLIYDHHSSLTTIKLPQQFIAHQLGKNLKKLTFPQFLAQTSDEQKILLKGIVDLM